MRMLGIEWQKIRSSTIWIPVLVAPLLATMVGILFAGQRHGNAGLAMKSDWLVVYEMTIQLYAMLFVPLCTGVIAAMVCRAEHLAGGWKQLLVMPVTRSSIYWAKLFWTLVFVALMQLLMLAGIVLIGLIYRYTGPIPWHDFWLGILGGWLAAIPLAALQLWVSFVWKSFGAPFAINVILTIPSIAVAHTHTYGPWYPWAQPLLAMTMSNGSTFALAGDSWITIIASAVMAVMCGWLHFVRRDVHA